MTDIIVRYNKESDDIEVVIGDKVVDTVGPELVSSWVGLYNEKHGYIKPETITSGTITASETKENNEETKQEDNEENKTD